MDNSNEGFTQMPAYIEKLLAREFSVHNEPPPIDFKLVKHQLDYQGNPEEIGVAASGELFIIYGPPKSRKTTMMNSLVAAAYVGHSDNEVDRDVCLDFEVRLEEDEWILFFDTEMPETAFHRRQKKMTHMCDYDDDFPQYKGYWLRGTPWEEKLDFIEYMIVKEYKDRCGLVMIDQVADLVPDINDREATNELISRIEYWTSETGCIIGSAIHTSRGTENPTGVIGAEFSKKIDSGLYIEKQYPSKHTLVKHLLAREREFENFGFTHDNSTGFPRLLNDEELMF